jgi:hypothetical protein
MSINFLKEKNVKMLWDVVSDEDIFRFLTPDNQIKIYQLFLNNIEGFSENEGTKTNSLVDLNKKYILLILNHIKKTYSPSKIKIHNEQQQQQQPLKELITFEEIQNDRKSQFEQDFNRIQEEFEDSISIKPPPLPEFTDPKGKTDEPIKEMDKILKEMQSRRNYEVEQINRSYNTSNVDNWLKPQETSLKTEKYENMKQEVQTNNRFKYLNELDNNLTPKKNVTFNNNDQVNTFISELEEVQDDEEINLFSKFKKVNKKEDNITLSINEEEDRISKLERSVTNLNEKMDKIISLLGERN